MGLVLILIGMSMPPIPIVRLFLLAGLGEIAITLVLVGLILAPCMVFVVVPVVIVMVFSVVNPFVVVFLFVSVLFVLAVLGMSDDCGRRD
jgi:hypothetical protein